MMGYAGAVLGNTYVGCNFQQEPSYKHQVLTSNEPPRTSMSLGLCQVIEVKAETPAQATMQQYIALLSGPLNPKP